MAGSWLVVASSVVFRGEGVMGHIKRIVWTVLVMRSMKGAAP